MRALGEVFMEHAQDTIRCRPRGLAALRGARECRKRPVVRQPRPVVSGQFRPRKGTGHKVKPAAPGQGRPNNARINARHITREVIAICHEPTLNNGASDMSAILTFIKELERLKQVKRTAWTSRGERESVAEHSWRLAVFALALKEQVQGLDMGRVLAMCLLHDLGEADEGEADTPAVAGEDRRTKLAREEQTVRRLLAPLADAAGSRLFALWWEYNRGETPEARFVKALDKPETITQHNQGQNPPDFDYDFNRNYGRKPAAHCSALKTLREIVDQPGDGG